MPEYDNTNSGVLWKNKQKKTPKHPDYTGKVNIDGKEKALAGWIKEGRESGDKFLSLKVSELRAAPPGGNDDPNDPPF